MIRRRLLELPLMALPIALFFFIASHQIDLPGLYYDEAIDSLPTVRMLQGRPQELHRDVGIVVNGYEYPVMVMEYVGPINTYALVPFFELWGISTGVERMAMVAFACLSVGLAWLFVRGLFGPAVATISGVLYAISPSFVFWSRQGVHVTSVMSVFLYGALAALVAWWRSRRAWLFWLACLCLGLGLTAKFLFLWFIVAIVALGGGLQWIELRRWGRKSWRLGWRELVPGGALFLFGAFPLIYYNVVSQGTIDVLTQNAYTSSYGVDNTNFVGNLDTRIHALRSLLYSDHFWFLGAVPRNDLYWTVFWGALALTVAGLVLSRTYRSDWKPVAFVWLFIVLVVVQSTVTVSSLQPTHFYALLPFPQIAIAAAFVLLVKALWRDVRWPPMRRRLAFSTAAAGGVVLLLVAAGDARSDLIYHQALADTGGLVAHSDAIYALAYTLETKKYYNPIALDWGIAASLEVATGGKLQPDELFLYAKDPPPLFDDLLYKRLTEPIGVYVLRADDVAVYPRRERFEYWIKRLEKHAELDAVIRQRDGKPLYLVYVVT